MTDPRCRSVSFTGSGEVGQRIAELAARRIVPVDPRARGEEPGDRLPGRRPRPGGQGDRLRRLRQRGPDVLGRLPRSSSPRRSADALVEKVERGRARPTGSGPGSSRRAKWGRSSPGPARPGPRVRRGCEGPGRPHRRGRGAADGARARAGQLPSARRSSTGSTPGPASSGTRCSARSSPCSPSRRRRMRSGSPTTPATGSSPPSGPGPGDRPHGRAPARGGDGLGERAAEHVPADPVRGDQGERDRLRAGRATPSRPTRGARTSSSTSGPRSRRRRSPGPVGRASSDGSALVAEPSPDDEIVAGLERARR